MTSACAQRRDERGRWAQMSSAAFTAGTPPGPVQTARCVRFVLLIITHFTHAVVMDPGLVISRTLLPTGVGCAAAEPASSRTPSTAPKSVPPMLHRRLPAWRLFVHRQRGALGRGELEGTEFYLDSLFCVHDLDKWEWRWAPRAAQQGAKMARVELRTWLVRGALCPRISAVGGLCLLPHRPMR